MTPTHAADLLVICLCAQWCGTCRDYESRFAQVQAKYPQAQFVWIDVEDEADLLHPLDVEDFPTVLLARGNDVLFLGPLTPQPQTLDRLIRAQNSPAVMPTAELAMASELLARIRAAKRLV